MDKRDILVIGTSAAGLSAMTQLFAGMPTGTSATVFVVTPISAGATSMLPRLLERAGWLPAFHPADDAPSGRGTSMWRRRTIICWSAKTAC